MNRRSFFRNIGLLGCTLNSGNCLSGTAESAHLQVQSLVLKHAGTQKILSIRLVSIADVQGNRTRPDTVVGSIETRISELDALYQLFSNAPTITRVELPVERSGSDASGPLQTTISALGSQRLRESLNDADLVLFIPSASGVVDMPLYAFVENVAQRVGTPTVSLVTQTMFFEQSECFVLQNSVREIGKIASHLPALMQGQTSAFPVQRFPRARCLSNVEHMFSEMCMRMTDMFSNDATIVHGVRDIKLYLCQLADVSRERELANNSAHSTATQPYEIHSCGYRIDRNGQEGSRIRAYLEASKTDMPDRVWDLADHLRCYSPKGALVARSGCVYCERNVMDGTVEIHKFEGRYVRPAASEA